MTAVENPPRVAPSPISTGPAPAPAAPVARRGVSTPTWLVVLLSSVVATALVLLAISEAAWGGQRRSLVTIGHRTAPSIIAAQNIYFSVADMDASLANYLLVGTSTKLGTTRAQTVQEYNADLTTATGGLLAAAENIAFGQAERGPIQQILTGVETYQADAAETEELSSAGNAPAALAEYRVATDLMHDQLFPAVTTLNDLNLGVLDAAYAHGRTAAHHDVFWVTAAVLVVAGALVLTQAFLTRRMRRLFNPWLAAASVVVVAFGVTCVVAMRAGQNDLKVAKKDAFDSVVALDTGRSIAYDANADESRYLIDPERAAQYQAAFLAKSLEITKLPTPVTIYTFDATLAPEIADAEKGRIDFGGYLGTELNNVTFPGERRAALATLQAWAVYEKDDRRLRADWTGGQQAEAIRFDTSTRPGDSDWAFDQFDAALTQTRAINVAYFNSSVQAGDRNLRGWTAIPIAAVLAVVVLTGIGLWPRIAEYR
jgi:hypothetical protein